MTQPPPSTVRRFVFLLLTTIALVAGRDAFEENNVESSTTEYEFTTVTSDIDEAAPLETNVSTAKPTYVTSTEPPKSESVVSSKPTETAPMSAGLIVQSALKKFGVDTNFAPKEKPREGGGVINSLQDMFRKVDNMAVGAILGSFDKETMSRGDSQNIIEPSEEDKKKLSYQIRSALRYYKDYREVAVPGADVPDPFPVPNFSKKMGGTPFSFYNTSMFGMSNYSILHINTNLEKMQVYVEVFIPRLTILGNYSAKSWFKKAAGPFNVTLLDVIASGAAALTRDDEGNLMASKSEIDMQFRDGRVDFKNLGLMGSLLQGILSGAAPILFDAMKPAVIGEINDKIRADVNQRLRIIGNKFTASNASSPLEQAIEETRKYIKNNGYDPFHIQNYVFNRSVVLLNISDFTLTGVSDFYKASDIELSMDNGTMELGLHIATKKLLGRCKWRFALGKSFSRRGWYNFTVDYIQSKFYVTQSLDISQHPVLRKLDINVGKITLDASGMGSLDFVAETLVNSLPDLLRHMIVDAIEIPITMQAQDILDRIDVQDLVDKTLPELDRIGV